MATQKPSKKVYPITTFISDLPTSLIPQSSSSYLENGTQSRRLVIVGDVHGMRKSLENLLEKIGFDKAKGDHLILAGDITNKGPDSSSVVDLAIKLGASAVRGNHDNAVLDAAAEIVANGGIDRFKGLIDALSTPDTPRGDLPKDTAPTEGSEKTGPATTNISLRHGATTYRTAFQLSAHQIKWLAALPLILRIQLPQNLPSSLGNSLIVAHAGLVPGIPLEEQDPHAVLHMRSLIRKPGEEEGYTPDESFGEEGWAAEWDRWQDKLASPTTVVFGHDAKRRLQLGRYTVGLDTACLYGNQLSALVISVNDAEIEHQIISVDCADTPVAPAAPVKEDNKAAVDK
ncbi:Metallo-dependent phosphatase [Penicillium cataractarum]|uniref:Metallo-dependent phosphatase n=1 Tax=Penicillium cataractarum TaxID=2100454 RepID=A0A9W9RY69_9EURO|nr:Metallo-dependent phosphatase [Penicillium cataractarum]KAJ5368568.1 Metallo-dependent phosphatase [Penicillium cataractarum]